MKVDLSHPDNTELVRGRSILVEAAWHFLGRPVVESRILVHSGLKRFVLRLFGAKIDRGVYLKPGLRVKFPWYLKIGEYCWIGEDVWIDNLAEVEIGGHCCVSQAVYFCTGNHDWSKPNMRLFRRPIRLENGCWVGAKSLIGPGVVMGEGAVLTAGSVATKSIGAWEIHGGNPAQFQRRRIVKTEGGAEE